MSMSLALSFCILFISLIQSVNRAQFLDIIFSFILFMTAAATKMSATIIIPFTSMYAYARL